MRVRRARAEDAGPLAALYRDNRDHLAPFEPARAEEFFTEAGQAARLAALLAEREQGRAYPYVIAGARQPARGANGKKKDSGPVSSPPGRLCASNVSRGPVASGSPVYCVAADQAGRGLSPRAVRTVVDDC